MLAQDVESGELAYKPVLAVTIRRPAPRMKIGLGTESITATPSHPFWVSGQGWRMTKQLEAGSRVHTLSGGVPVENDRERLERRIPGRRAGLQPDRGRLTAAILSATAGSWSTTTRRAGPRPPKCRAWHRSRNWLAFDWIASPPPHCGAGRVAIRPFRPKTLPFKGDDHGSVKVPRTDSGRSGNARDRISRAH